MINSGHKGTYCILVEWSQPAEQREEKKRYMLSPIIPKNHASKFMGENKPDIS